MNLPPPTKKQARMLWYSLTALAVAILLVLIGLVLWAAGWVLHRLSAVLVPMAFALILAYILDPVVEYFVRKRLPRLWAVCLVFVLGILVIATVFGSVLPGLQDETRSLAEELPKNVEYVRSRAQHFVQEMPASLRSALFPADQPLTNGAGPLPAVSFTTNAAATTITLAPTSAENGTNVISTNSAALPAGPASELNQANVKAAIPGLSRALVYVAKWFQEQLGKVTTWLEFLIGFVLVPIYLFYFLLEKEQIRQKWQDYLPIKESAAKTETVFVLQAINDCLIVFFRGQVLVALCVGTLLTIGYLLMGLNYAVLLGLVAAALGIVPYLGTITTLALALSVAGIQFKDWTHPLMVLGLAVVVKLLEDFVISPRIIGGRVGLHPLTVILAVLIGTTLLGGFTGALLAIPLTAALRTLMFRYIWTRDHTGEKPAESEAVTELAE